MLQRHLLKRLLEVLQGFPITGELGCSGTLRQQTARLHIASHLMIKLPQGQYDQGIVRLELVGSFELLQRVLQTVFTRKTDPEQQVEFS